ncbi:hypothetical protein G7054_g1352 [Neopestalotiopsis clavispora]|nr:hypothetical protein G7054_g1352 [Neopestalotiopsis clavispora]
MASTEQISSFLESLGLTRDQSRLVIQDNCKNGTFAERTIAAIYPHAVDMPGTTAYQESISTNWSILVRKKASQVVHPSSPEEIGTILRILEFFARPFAIRGGGHSPNAGWAGIEGGVLLSMDRFTNLHYNESTKVVSIGAGNKWGTVYRYLEKFGVLVTGGHSAPVGCVGQITGCGNSPWFHKYGWSCDNVLNFEIVVSGGKTINANKDENADLWWALKGGSNNFRIVTRLDMATFPMPNGVWGGVIAYKHSQEAQDQTTEAYYKFQMERITKDPGVEVLAGWGKFGPHKYIQNVLSADRRQEEGTHPEAFNDFFDLKPYSQQVGSCKASELAAHDDPTNMSDESKIYFSEGTRSQMLCMTVAADLIYYREAAEIFYSTYERLDGCKDAIACMNMSPITANTVRNSIAKGGNACGWSEAEQTIVFLDNAWLNSCDDELMWEMSAQCMKRLRAAAKARGIFMPQVWMNNAGPDDDVIKSYGEANWNKLRDVSLRYDPPRTFQRLCAGGYKIEK